MRVLPVLIALLVAGCLEGGGEGGDSTTTTTPATLPTAQSNAMCVEGAPDCEDTVGSEAPDANVSLRTLAVGQQTGAHPEQRLIIRDEAKWRAFWDEHGSTQFPAPERPAVDFPREAVAVAILDEKPSGCFALRIREMFVDPAAQRTTFHATTYAPEPGGPCAAVMTRPFHYVAFEDPGFEVSWEDRSEVGAPPQG